ncbi:MAG: SDR family oxidoreductase, partial [Candidatus Micrarchaeota archaeon]|nr:SDR family oxidoreductase [Candidatus Micrarchaeota archaeon]
YGNQNGGRIVNITSIQGIAALRPGTSYQATKAGIIGLTIATAIELAEHGINVNAIAPGAIATEGMGKMRFDDSGASALDAYRKRIPLGRRGNAFEVAGPVLFLCSERSTYITGEVLRVDGGWLANATPDSITSKRPKQRNDPD